MAEHTKEIVLGVVGWYLTSFGTLLLNKHLLGELHVQPNSLAVVQMVSTAIYGGLKNINFSVFCGGTGNTESTEDLEQPHSHKGHTSGPAWRRTFSLMSLVGGMRFATVVLGLVSLKYVAASFTETIKASAPFFTVIIAYLMLGERTSAMVVVSLVPVAAGLVMVSYAELSFNIIGFSAAILTNIIECIQNVFSKQLLTKDYTASQLQFYTSLTALVLQAPIFIGTFLWYATPPSPPILALTANETAVIAVDGSARVLQRGNESLDIHTLGLLWLAGVLYHLQSVVAYVVMTYMSPVSVSVINTIKRAMAIWVSVLFFGNEVTLGAKIGTLICLLGAFWYNVERQKSTATPVNS